MENSRAKKALNSTLFGLVYQLTNIVCSLILPRLIILAFGSDYNGMTNSITQFLNVIWLFEAGIGAVTVAALYRPLAERDTVEISVIVQTTQIFLRKVCFMFVGAVAVIAVVYPQLVRDYFDIWFTAALVITMSLGTIADYFFGQAYQLLLLADQRNAIVSVANTLKIILSTVVAVVMIKIGSDLIVVKAASAIVFIVVPLVLNHYVKHRYDLITTVKSDSSKLNQRWENFGQQVAQFACTNTALVVLTIFSNVYEISVYTIYAMICGAVFGLFSPLVQNVGAAFGNMLAKGETEAVVTNLRRYEQVVFASSTFLFSVTSAMIIPFVGIYTRGVSDVNYTRIVFAYLITAANLFRCYRFPYQSIANAAGHFRQMRVAAYSETGISILLSVLLVTRYGIEGVAFAALMAYIYRTIMYASYVSRNFVRRSAIVYIRRIILSLAIVTTISIVQSMGILTIYTNSQNYLEWVINALPIALVSLILVVASEWIFYREDSRSLIRLAENTMRRRRN